MAKKRDRYTYTGINAIQYLHGFMLENDCYGGFSKYKNLNKGEIIVKMPNFVTKKQKETIKLVIKFQSIKAICEYLKMTHSIFTNRIQSLYRQFDIAKYERTSPKFQALREFLIENIDKIEHLEVRNKSKKIQNPINVVEYDNLQS